MLCVSGDNRLSFESNCRAGVLMPTPPSDQSGRGLLAIIALLIGSTLWGLYWLPLRLLESAGLGGLWALVFVYTGATLVLLVPAHRVLRPWHRARPALIGIGVSGAVSGIAFGLGMIEGQVARVMMLFYLAPIWTVLMARFALREPLSPVTLPALAMALAGAAMMLVGGAERGFGRFAHADLLGLIAGVAFALTNVQLRAQRALPLPLKTLASAYLAPPLALALALLLERPLAAPPLALAGALLLGAVWMSSMLVAVQIGVRALPLQQSSVLLLFELIVGALSAAVIAGEALGPWELAGGLAIVGAGLAVVWGGAAARRGGAERG